MNCINCFATPAYFAFLLRRFLSRVDRQLFVQMLREARAFVEPEVQQDFDFVIDVLEDPEQEASHAFKAILALARAHHPARTLIN